MKNDTVTAPNPVFSYGSYTFIFIMERRTDYILDRTVYVSPHRGDRPHEFKRRNERTEPDSCVFCPGNEDRTPEDIGRVTDGDGNWRVRWFPNEFPAVVSNPVQSDAHDGEFFSSQASYGHHEVIIDTPDHGRQMADLTTEEMETVFSVYRNRADALYGKPDIEAVTVFKNHGPDAGTSIIHSHSQVIATPFVPEVLRSEINAVTRYDTCPYCQVVASERTGKRFCFENDSFVAFTPYASRHEYELWLFPRNHASSFRALPTSDLVPLLKRALKRLQDRGASYNYVLHGAPDVDPFHAHLELYPRTGSWGGFERGTGTMINPVPPERAAKFYRRDVV